MRGLEMQAQEQHEAVRREATPGLAWHGQLRPARPSAGAPAPSVDVHPGAAQVSPPPSYEQKYLTADAHQQFVLAWLDRTCRLDLRFPVDCVTSVYYDTPTLHFYAQKRNSEYMKTKLRLRWYGAADARTATVTCYLELKRKCGACRLKERIEVVVPASSLTDPLTDPVICELPHVVTPRRWSLPQLLVPMARIEYVRRRYRDPATGSSVAFDNAIQCTQINQRLLPARLPVRIPVGVLEVKGSHRVLPSTFRPVTPFLHRRSFSKYAVCCEYATDFSGRCF